MRLLTKISLHYLWVTGVLLLVAGFLLFAFLKRNISEEIREELQLQSELVAYEIKTGNEIKFPLIKIEKGIPLGDARPVFKDTLVFDPLQGKNEDYFFLTTHQIINGKPYRITVLTSYIGWEEYLKAITYTCAVLAALLICCGLVVNYLSSRNIWGPFLQNMGILSKFSIAENKEPELVKSDIKEFAELNAIILSFVAHARREYKNLQEFSENASHELQTPISIVRARLESISQQPVDSRVAGYLVDAKASLERLSKVNKGLLLLAKLEYNAFPDLQKISLTNLVVDMIAQFEELFIAKGLQLQRDIQVGVNVVASPHLVSILLSNLLSNMRHHTASGQYVGVALLANKLIFTNQGPQLGFPGDLLFTRFNKGRSASSGIGLGLSIIKQICQFHGWQITYTYTNGHHLFCVNFSSTAA